MGHKHDYLHLEAFCRFHNVVVHDVVGAVVDDDVVGAVDVEAVVAVDVEAVVAVDVEAVVAVDVEVVVAAVVVVVAAAAAVVAVAVAVEEACPVLDRKLQYLGPLSPKWEEIFFGRSLPYVDHEAAKWKVIGLIEHVREANDR